MQTHRFEEGRGFDGNLIDRARPVSFRFNKKLYFGFKGDTLFTALRANGVIGVATNTNARHALNSETAQRIRAQSLDDPIQTLSLFDTKIEDTQEYVAAPAPSIFERIYGGLFLHKNTLLLSRNKANGSHVGQPAEDDHHCEVVVLGGGISGLQAALKAASQGHRVVLLEASSRLGGMTDYYGQAEHDEDPDLLVDSLKERVNTSNDIKVIHQTEALDVRANTVVAEMRTHSQTRITRFVFEKLVIAVGANYGRFLGGRKLPAGVFDAVETFRIAKDYGVAPGREVDVVTGGNSGYRMAYLLSEGGVDVKGIWDPRVGTSSRHIDFAKAIGIKIRQGEALSEFGAKASRVEASFVSPFGAKRSVDQIFDTMIVSDAPVPNTYLWTRSGGRVDFDEQRQAFFPISRLSNVEIVGSAAGAITQKECLMQAQEVFDNQAGSRLGNYLYEDAPQPLSYLGKIGAIEEVREVANVPNFVRNPSANACTEFAFNHIQPSEKVPRSLKSKTGSRPSEVHRRILKELTKRYQKPAFYRLKNEAAELFAPGHPIFDGDGIGGAANRIGFTATAQGTLFGVFESGTIEVETRVFIHSRKGMSGCTVGEQETTPEIYAE